ncbi:hypothetical protein [Winogradskyella haliclonae]|uniref:Lipoprotein n=1 Tax=Winogradskyella haliclonae TaxID=2048558 RepID=A0ABQ2C150_9FLAO|nr:hypothetical protein [Winogradskyella haliclonae]GGI58472.1 hypothetical protein GCM10011444_27810 [Winogradskyella haliclonae]
MRIISRALALFIAISLTSCITTKTIKATSSVPAGTEVAYSKVVNPAYARDYIGADIITEVEFYSAGKARNEATKVPKGHVVFQVIPIGGTPKDAPFGGGQLGDYVFIPKDKSDIIFDLKRGDKIQLRGGTRVQKYIINGIEIIEFVATSIQKL